MAELVARTSLPRPTIHRVLNTLIEHGWIRRDEASARFNLAMGLAALGYFAISRNPIEQIATTHLSVLAEQLNQVVYMGVRPASTWCASAVMKARRKYRSDKGVSACAALSA